MATKQKTRSYTFRATEREARILAAYCKKWGMTPSEGLRSLMSEKMFYFALDEGLIEGGKTKAPADFTNEQVFKIGQKVEFYCKPASSDKFAGIHIVRKFHKDSDGVARVQTDVSQRIAVPRDLWIAVHWFRAIKSKA